MDSEHPRLEFKEAKTQFDNTKLYQYCVAIANERGGQLLLGVTDKLPRKIAGTAAFSNPGVRFQVSGVRKTLKPETWNPEPAFSFSCIFGVLGVHYSQGFGPGSRMQRRKP